MFLKTLLATLVLSIAPSLALAQCSGHGTEQASSCVSGYVWDNDARACVPQITG